MRSGMLSKRSGLHDNAPTNKLHAVMETIFESDFLRIHSYLNELIYYCKLFGEKSLNKDFNHSFLIVLFCSKTSYMVNLRKLHILQIQ